MTSLAHLPFTQMMTHEANIRGIYLSIACDYEKYMVQLIQLTELIDKDENDRNKIIIRELSMGKKLDRSKSSLKKYNEGYYTSNQYIFINIKKLVDYRNILAYGFAVYDNHNKDNSYVEFDFVKNGKKYLKKIILEDFYSEMDSIRNNLEYLVVLLDKILVEKVS